ncbi:DUF983 domain-containing protein [Roseixanthobacter glucoisosaccharinicivorans]|uniref:DUF983 domain-containing protein n=1 Tax=Roseixanthobacter glucoisosaccharinicivorans TaxID=3119923 RepID=UPI00372C0822
MSAIDPTGRSYVYGKTAPVSGGERPLGRALARGALGRCPQCGTGRLFSSYIKVNEACPVCDEEFYHHRADDAPPYAVIFVVGHIVVPLLVLVEEVFRPEVWVHLVTFLPLTLVLSLVLLPVLKGALIALQWSRRMHGFDPNSPEREPRPSALPTASQ